MKPTSNATSAWLVHVLEKSGMIEKSLATARASCLRHSEMENLGGGTEEFSKPSMSIINILETQWLKKSLCCTQQPAGNGAFTTIGNSRGGYFSTTSFYYMHQAEKVRKWIQHAEHTIGYGWKVITRSSCNLVACCVWMLWSSAVVIAMMKFL
ncbi:hypothetical protein F5141DRAFT_1064356 [Pisolithus sp. B1]|nr:hypothetical protein F5141DRAFT_1064356 [Pisolithus sp. B1]